MIGNIGKEWSAQCDLGLITIRSVFTGPFWNWRLDVERWPGYSPVVDNKNPDKISILAEISIAGVGF